MTLKDFVKKHVTYEIICSLCAFSVERQSEEDAAVGATYHGFEVFDDEIYCPECLEIEQQKNEKSL